MGQWGKFFKVFFKTVTDSGRSILKNYDECLTSIQTIKLFCLLQKIVIHIAV